MDYLQMDFGAPMAYADASLL